MVSKQPPHGTRARYRTCKAGTNGSKCDPCKAANNKYHREYHSKRKKIKIPDNVEHGTDSVYVHWVCRCSLCYLAHLVTKEKSRQKRRDAMVKSLRSRTLQDIIKDAQERVVEAHKKGIHATKLKYCPLCTEEENGKTHSPSS